MTAVSESKKDYERLRQLLDVRTPQKPEIIVNKTFDLLRRLTEAHSNKDFVMNLKDGWEREVLLKEATEEVENIKALLLENNIRNGRSGL